MTTYPSQPMSDQKSKIQRGVDYIAKHPGCRTQDLAKAMDTKQENVIPTLQDAIKAGLILTCKVTRPGLVPCNEFKLSTACPEGKGPDWREFKISQRTPKELKPIPQPVPRVHEAGKTQCVVGTTPAGRGEITPATEAATTSLASRFIVAGPAVVEPPKLAEAPAEASSDEIDIAHSFHAFDRALVEDDSDSPPLRFAIDSQGYFRVERDGKTILQLAKSDTASLGLFMEGTSKIWEEHL